MPTVIVRGHSDDIVIVEGGGFLEEFHPPSDTRTYLGFSDGTALSADYDRNGIWRFHRLFAGTAIFEKTEGRIDPDDGTDIVLLKSDDPIKWVVFGEQLQVGNLGAANA
jgi:hypothetical protein